MATTGGVSDGVRRGVLFPVDDGGCCCDVSFASPPRALFTFVGTTGATAGSGGALTRRVVLRDFVTNLGYTSCTGIRGENSLVCSELHTARRSETLLGVTKEVSKVDC